MDRITFLGDVSLLCNAMSSNYSLEGEYIFNLEYVLNNKGCPKPNKVNLRENEVDFRHIFGKNPIAVTLGNNHIMDFGVEGLNETIRVLERENIKYCGAGGANNNYNNPLIIIANKNKVGLMSYSMFDEREQEVGVDFFSIDKMERDIKYLKDNSVNIIIVNMHWGEEEAPLHNEIQSKIGRILIDKGVDLVIGHHPHCIQPFEVYKDKYIFYSLGNCMFPDLNVDAFYDKQGKSQRKFRKRQMKHNKISYAVCFDVDINKVVKIDKLIFNKNILSKVKQVDLDEKTHNNAKMSKIKKCIRKYGGFIWSNLFVEGMIFDYHSLKHEIKMKIRR